MGDLISLANKRQRCDKEKAGQQRRHKIRAVRRVLQCTQCAAKCEKCGAGISQGEPDPKKQLRIPYQLCEECGDEYIDYIERLQGRGDAEQYWHNEAWMKIWRAWIDYQGAIDQYLKTREFERLLDELRTTQDQTTE
ncbi:MAG: hypothetical protein P8010_03340 [Desulfosarcinaceae bacterium]|jgi:hypothetical protein